MRNRLLPVLSITGAVALTLTACTGAQPDPDVPPAIEVDTVEVPDALLPSDDAAYVGYGMVAATGELPWIIGGSRAEPGEAAVPTVWTSADGASWTPSTVGEAKGDFSGVVRGSDSLAALGGTVWNEGATTSALWTSADGDKWSPVTLPEEFRTDLRLSSFAVDGDVVFGIGIDDDGNAAGLLVDGDDVATVDLPKTDDDVLLRPQSVALAGDTVVIHATTGAEGEPAPSVSYTSDDGGDSWGPAATITDEVGSVAGVIAVDEGFVATGSTPRGDGANGLAAWFSDDGESWAAESVPAAPQDGALFTFENSDTWLGTPLQRGGVVSAVMGNDNSALSGVYARQPGGSWSFVGASTPNSTNGAGGVVIPGDDGSYLGAIIGSSYARMGVVSGAWSDTTALSEREDISSVVAIYPDDNGARVTLNRSTFTVEPDLDWRNQSSVSLAELSDGELQEAAWDPEAASAWAGTQLASDGDAQLVLGSYFDIAKRVIPVQGYFRASDDAEWQAVTGFGPGEATSLNGAEKIGDTWVAYGATRATSASADPEHAVLWTSPDGLSWTRVSGDFGSGTLESDLADVCALPSGELIGVGWTEVSDGDYRTSVWNGGDAWSSADIGSLADSYGFATSCASDDEGVILGATVGGRDTLQRSTDGAKWKEVFRADRGIYIGEPVAVEGGFAASGSSSSSEFSGPVVWLSKSGTDWRPVSIPSWGNGSTSTVSPVGDDLVVAMSGRIGDPLVVIRDIATVIAEKG